jgi:hypothetical protein
VHALLDIERTRRGLRESNLTALVWGRATRSFDGNCGVITTGWYYSP